jgi:serine protease Do
MRLILRLLSITSVGLSAMGSFSSIDAQEDTAASVAHAHNLSRAFRHAADRATPAVVAITVKLDTSPQVGVRNPEGIQNLPPEIRRFLEQFGGDMQFHQFDGGASGKPSEGTGSGVIIDPRGIVLTNNHVVQGAVELTVQLADGRTFTGSNIKTDKLTDLAIFTIEGAKDLTAISIGKSDEMEIGDWVIAIGSPFELHHTVSAGIISGKGRSLSAASRSQFLQTDAAINPGNSGGPLVNLQGELIGINTAIASRSGGYNGIGFAIPSRTVSWVTEELLDDGIVQRSYLGVQIQEMTDKLSKQFRLPRRGGVIVSAIIPGSPGANAGLVSGDVITHFAGTKVGTPSELQSVVERSSIANSHVVLLVRDGKPLSINITLASLPSSKQLSKQLNPTQRGSAENIADQKVMSEKLGLTVSPADANKRGVKIVGVLPGSLASRAGIPTGSILQGMDQKPISSIGEFAAAADAMNIEKGVMLQIQNGNGSAFVVLQGS